MPAPARRPLPPKLAQRETQMKLLQENLARVRKGEAPVDAQGQPVALQEAGIPGRGDPNSLSQPQPQARVPVVVPGQVLKEQLQAQRPDLSNSNQRFIPEAPEVVEDAPLQDALEESPLAPASQPSPELLLAQSQLANATRLAEESAQRARELQARLDAREEADADAANAVVTAEEIAANFSEADIELHGEAALRLMLMTAKKIAGSSVRSQVKKEVDKIKAEMLPDREAIQQTRESLFFDAVKAAHKDWETINKQPKWLAWLAEKDPIARVIRQALLTNARTNLDSAAVIDMFTAYKATLQPAAPARRQAILPTSRGGDLLKPAGDSTLTITRADIVEKARQYTQGRITKEAYREFQGHVDAATRAGTIR